MKQPEIDFQVNDIQLINVFHQINIYQNQLQLNNLKYIRQVVQFLILFLVHKQVSIYDQCHYFELNNMIVHQLMSKLYLHHYSTWPKEKLFELTNKRRWIFLSVVPNCF